MVLLTKKTNIKTKVKIKTGVNMRFFFLSILLINIFATKLSACAGTWREMYIKDEYYNFTDPDMVHLPRDNPLYKLSGAYAAHDARFKYFAKQKKEANIKAWQSYFQDALSLKNIESLFYKKNSIKHSAKYYKNSTEFPQFGKYINFLHLQNKFAQSLEVNNRQEIIQKGLTLFNQEHEPFLKERYLYLLMRLYHHNGQYHELLDIHANNALIVNPQSIVKEWIDALRAGTYQQLKQRTKANQLYAKIFATHKTNAHYGFYDFKINNDEEWQSLLNSTTDKETQALYYFLRAMQWENEPLHELENIVALAPDSIWLERLTYMIMQKLQNKRYSIMVHAGKKNKYFKAKVKSYKLQKKLFLEILSKLEKQTFFTLYSKLYLNVLEYNSLKRKEVVKLRTLANNKQAPFVDLLTYIYGVHQLSCNSHQEQYALYQQLKPLLPKFSAIKQKSILRYTVLQISTLDGDNTIEKKLNKLFAQNNNYRSTILTALNYVDARKFQTYVEKEKRSFFEEQVFKKTMSKLEKRDVAKILATLYLQKNDFKQAQFYLRQIPQKNVHTPYNPFNVSISSSNRTISKKSYSQKKFVETMLRIKRALEKDPTSAMDHFLYANGLFNKSWFGNFPMSSVLYRSTYLTKDERLPKTADLLLAKKQYELALKYAEGDSFKAKIAYQLLKIEFNLAISDTEKYGDNIWNMPRFGGWNKGTKNVIHLLKASEDFTEGIRDFKDDYGHTKYAQDIIKQCITFKYF
ncbi:MAG: Unknown protein [uncultured Sulfurovum sp.]|uniref:Uncharacterized protein n=1 Tax=uncultured Sulfurovum sp. TaxID=269237 RepID=A0A6S6SUY3_9BACT|nr:MAG: Unknown protein [uncultured Sulfurovum sp.]